MTVEIKNLQSYGTETCLEMVKFLILNGYSVEYDYKSDYIRATK